MKKSNNEFTFFFHQTLRAMYNSVCIAYEPAHEFCTDFSLILYALTRKPCIDIRIYRKMTHSQLYTCCVYKV